ncbi:MAG: hypothetical protein LBI35_00775 [Burkholderiales bacterium]|jgi:hypothetical protein|nr:hypothetical protein [Burkholderiales bacterium]
MKVRATKFYKHQGKDVSPNVEFESDRGEELIRNGLAVAVDAAEANKKETKPAKAKAAKE